MDGLIEGVTLYTLKRIKNPKGDILHALKCTDEGFGGFGEAYFTQIHSKEVKGWKRHNKMTLNLVVVAGCVKFVIYDDRENSITIRKRYDGASYTITEFQNRIVIAIIMVVPVLIIVAGIIVSRVRRRKRDGIMDVLFGYKSMPEWHKKYKKLFYL